MRTSLVHFLSTDRLQLPGLLYEPTNKSDRAMIYLHGNGSSSIFYSEDTNILGRTLTKAGIAFLPFNNRGAHYIKTLKQMNENNEEERLLYGTSYELIKDCIKDIDGAIAFLQSKGYRTLYIMGESTGANKIVVYNFYKKKNPIKKHLLLSGGDDTGLYYDELGAKKYHLAFEKARAAVAAGHGMKLVPQYIMPEPYSYQSLFDILNPDGDYNTFPFNEYFNNLHLSKKPLFSEYATLNKPTLVIYGSNDEYCYGDVPRCVDALKQHTTHPELVTFKVIDAADHGFSGKEQELANTIISWL